MVHHCFYESRAASAFPALVDFDILREAWAHNRAAGLTGYLLRTREAYFQWIEGPETALWPLMDRIRRDRRHSALRVIAEGPRPAREFGAWAMGYHELSGDEARAVAGTPGNGAGRAEAALRLLRGLAARRAD